MSSSGPHSLSSVHRTIAYGNGAVPPLRPALRATHLSSRPELVEEAGGEADRPSGRDGVGGGAFICDGPRTVLVVAGSDSSGGAGLSRDVEAVVASGLRATLAVTAVTVQTHDEVRAIEHLPAALVAAQMEAAFDAGPVGAVKIGMLGTGETIKAVASVLEGQPKVLAVLDPVLAASSGGALLAPPGAAILMERLIPSVTLVTPNWPELARLTGNRPAASEGEAIAQGEALLARGCRALLVKGGHAPGDRSTDLLLRPGCAPLRFDAPRLEIRRRGTGCALASFIAAGLARGLALEDSIAFGKARVLGMLLEA